MILKYLVPVKLSLGILPKDWLLEKYNLVEVLSYNYASYISCEQSLSKKRGRGLDKSKLFYLTLVVS